MKTYNITVNGRVYQVEVQESRGRTAPMASVSAPRVSAPAPVQPVAAPTPAPSAAPAPAPAPVVEAVNVPAGEGKSVEAPMPGKILNIHVSEGQQVTQNQALCILEAMKMENEICAPVAGTVAKIHVAKGEAVDTGKLLFTIV